MVCFKDFDIAWSKKLFHFIPTFRKIDFNNFCGILQRVIFHHTKPLRVFYSMRHKTYSRVEQKHKCANLNLQSLLPPTSTLVQLDIEQRRPGNRFVLKFLGDHLVWISFRILIIPKDKNLSHSTITEQHQAMLQVMRAF